MEFPLLIIQETMTRSGRKSFCNHFSVFSALHNRKWLGPWWNLTSSFLFDNFLSSSPRPSHTPYIKSTTLQQLSIVWKTTFLILGCHRARFFYSITADLKTNKMETAENPKEEDAAYGECFHVMCALKPHINTHTFGLGWVLWPGRILAFSTSW